MEKKVHKSKDILDGIAFPCPKCSKEIVRSNKSRRLSITYTCSHCGFVGP